MKATIFIFFAFFGLYLGTLPPALAPYRDAGEMSASSHTLGVSHPTSYPLYIALGHAFQLPPLGNRAYRLNLLSALCAALAVAAVFWLCGRRWGQAAGLAAALLLGLNATFWSVAQVQEMYSLWVLGAVALMGLALELRRAYHERLWLGFAFLYGLCLTNRLDLLLWAPGLLWLARGVQGGASWAGLAFLAFPALILATASNLPIAVLILLTALWGAMPGARVGDSRGPDQEASPLSVSWALRSAGFAALGLSLYAYLPARSASFPWLDWNHPAVFSNFIDSLLRTKYGGTLDLLSKNYAMGELFGANMRLYGRHLWENFSAPGLAAALWGLAASARSDSRRALGAAAAYWWSGPVFLFIANMPPNPHAAAIVEPHYLLSDLIVVFWAAEGFAALGAGPLKALAWPAALALAVLPLAQGRLERMDRRFHFFSYDYAKNILRCVAPQGVLVAKKDVQLYTLWHYQTVQGWRRDVRVVAQGLAGSSWYQEGWRRRDATLGLSPLRDDEGWARFLSLNPRVLATLDCELPPRAAAAAKLRGLVSAWPPAAPDPSSGIEAESAAERALSRGNAASDALGAALWEISARRGRYAYEGQPDFFTSDLVENYAQARLRWGSESFLAGRVPEAASALLEAWSLHWIFPEPVVMLGYLEFSRKDYRAALGYYGFAASLYEEMALLAERYHSLPELKGGIRRSAAESLMHLGVTSERTGDRQAARAYYRRSLEKEPLAQTHYNLAVLYWSQDREAARRELEAALSLDPRHAEAAKYLALLRSRSPKS